MSDIYPALLRALADLIEEHDLISPSTITASWVTVHSYDEDAPAKLAAWRRALGDGIWTKAAHGDSITLAAKASRLPGRPVVSLFIGKNSCVRRVIGVETVEVPAVEAQPATTEEREIVEWDCEPVLAGVAS